jgi:hypothetical protein
MAWIFGFGDLHKSRIQSASVPAQRPQNKHEELNGMSYVLDPNRAELSA